MITAVVVIAVVALLPQLVFVAFFYSAAAILHVTVLRIEHFVYVSIYTKYILIINIHI